MDMFQRPHLARPDQPRAHMSTPTDPADRWDWSSTMVVLLIVILVLVLTFEIWSPHFGMH
jgi:hypothetical protein